MRRIIKHTLTVTSTETWTISFESSQSLEALPTEEKPASVTDVIVAKGADLLLQQHADQEAEDVKLAGVTQSTIEKKRD
jgi:hypothetical protein